MPQSITAVTLVVHDYDEVIHFFTHALRFAVVEDTPLPGGKRWVTVRPPGGGTALLLAKAATPDQSARVGDQTGGRVFLFLQTDDFWRDYHEMRGRCVRFAEEPRVEGSKGTGPWPCSSTCAATAGTWWGHGCSLPPPRRASAARVRRAVREDHSVVSPMCRASRNAHHDPRWPIRHSA